MNRFDKPRQYDYSFDRYMPEFYMPNFEAWGQVVANRAKEDAAMQELLAKMPKYIEEEEYSYKNDKGETITEKYGDTEAFKNYAKKIEGFQKAINEAALAGDGNRYRQLMKEAQREISKDWGAMGTATILEERKKSFVEGMKKLKEYEEKATDGGKWAAVNKNYAQLQFLKGVGVYKPDDSGYKGIIEPSVFPYVDIKEEALKYMKEAGYNDIEIENLPDNKGWQFKSRTKSITDEALKGLNEHLRSENFAKQYEIERFGVFQKSDFSDIQEGVTEHNQKVAVVNKQFDETQALVTALENDDKTKDKVKELQKGLKAFGLYDGEIDGDYGPKTSEAAKKFKSYTKEQLGVQELTPQQYVQKGLESKYRTVAYGTIDYLKSDVLSQPYILSLKNGYDINLEKLKQRIAVKESGPTASFGQDVAIDYGNIQEDAQVATNNKQRMEEVFLKQTQTYFWNKGDETRPVTKTNMNDFYSATIEIYNENQNITAEELKNELWNEWGYNVKDANVLLDDLKNNRYQKTYEEFQSAKINEANFAGRSAESAEIVLKNLDKNVFVNRGLGDAPNVVFRRGVELQIDGKNQFVTKEQIKNILIGQDSQLTPEEQKIKAAVLKKEKAIPADKKQDGYRKEVHYDPSKGGLVADQLSTTERDFRNESIQTAVSKVKPEYAQLFANNNLLLDKEGGGLGFPTILGSSTGIVIPLVNTSGDKPSKESVTVYLSDIYPPSERQELAKNMVLDNFDQEGHFIGKGASSLHIGGIFSFVENTGRNIVTNEGAKSLMKNRKAGEDALPIITWTYQKEGKEFKFQISGKRDAGGREYYILQNDNNFGLNAPPSWQTIDSFEDIESAEASWGVRIVNPDYYEEVKERPKTFSPKFRFKR